MNTERFRQIVSEELPSHIRLLPFYGELSDRFELCFCETSNQDYEVALAVNRYCFLEAISKVDPGPPTEAEMEEAIWQSLDHKIVVSSKFRREELIEKAAREFVRSFVINRIVWSFNLRLRLPGSPKPSASFGSR